MSMLHYTACGLDNVWLKNGYRVVKTAYGKGTSIEHADELHKVLASKLVAKKGRLTGKEFRFLRVQLGMSQGAIAKLQGVTDQAVSLWERTGKIPAAHDMLAKLCYIAHTTSQMPISEAIERVKVVDKLVNERIVASTVRAKWSSKVEHLPEPAAAE
jgi:DNA-binding transcriptional regulator YiaG